MGQPYEPLKSYDVGMSDSRSFSRIASRRASTIKRRAKKTGDPAPLMKSRLPSTSRRETMREVPEAIRYLEEGRAKGKIVITV